MGDSESGSGLGRSSIEAYGGILVGIAAVVIPSWWAQATLLLIASGLALHLSLQAPVMLRRALWVRISTGGLSVVLILSGGGVLVQQQYLKEHPKTVNTSVTSPAMARGSTLRDLFKRDFTQGVKIEQDYVMTGSGRKVTVSVKRVLDFDSGAMFIAFYIPQSSLANSIFYHIADHISDYVDPSYGVVGAQRRSSGDSMAVRTSEMKFSGLVYLYSEVDLDLPLKAKLEERFKAKGLLMQFRSLDYEDTHNR